MEQIQGTVIGKRFEAADGYAVIEIDGDEPMIVVGHMPFIKTGELTRFTGEFKIHPRFGRQFECTSYESIQPVARDDMVRFLASDFVKGLGNVLAERLVEAFGEKTFDVIEKTPEKLTSVKGISRRLARSLHDTFVDYAESKNRYAELMGLGLSASQAAQAAEELGGDAAEQIQKDPYVLIEKVRGFDFMSADRLAKDLGVEPDSPLRVQRAVLHVLRKSHRERGDMCVPRKAVVNAVQKNLNVAPELVNDCIDRLCLEGQIAVRDYGEPMQAAQCKEAVFLQSAYDTETEAAALLTRIQASQPEGADEDPPGIQQIAAREGLSEEQVNAVWGTWHNPLTVITGGPGTGKTTIVKAALRMFGYAGLECALAAPTGRAAKRMQEATGKDARTIHRLLEFTYDDESLSGAFRINEDNPLDSDVVIIDEMSMVDSFLFRDLLLGIRPGTRLVLIGDANQLPSVGPGNVMQDLVSCGCVPVYTLNYIYRNSGRIAQSASEILHGMIPEFDDTELILRVCRSSDEVAQEVCRAYTSATNAGEDVQVLAPIKRPPIGSVPLNNYLRDAVNPNNGIMPEIIRGERIYRLGDRVMQVVNNYSREWVNHDTGEEGDGVYNGDIGIITSIDGPDVEVVFDDGRTVFYNVDEIDELDGAFAYTIHKAQGSEFESVILPMYYGDFPFLSRSLLYTAVTRAKKRVTVIGSEACFAAMVRNNGGRSRWTMLKQELQLMHNAAAGSNAMR